MSSSTCPLCARSFECGATDTSQPCWCVALPALPLEALGPQGCYCPDCLQQQLLQRGLLPVKQEAA
jgi:hypothetical protein